MTGFHVYAMVTAPIAGCRFVKFGLSRDIPRRLSEIQTCCPLPIERLYAVECGSAEAMERIEASLHDEHAKQSITGEWFQFPDDCNTLADVQFAMRCIGEREIGAAEVVEHPVPGASIRKDFAVRRRRRALLAFATVGDRSLDGVPVVRKRRKLALDSGSEG